MNLQHNHHDLIISTTHAHLDHNTCLQVIVVKGVSKACSQFGRSIGWSPGRAARPSCDQLALHLPQQDCLGNLMRGTFQYRAVD